MHNKIIKLFLGIVCSWYLFLSGCTAKQVEVPHPVILESSPEVVLPTRTYINTKYSFIFQYPSIFSQKREDNEQGGIQLWDEDSMLTIWGSPRQSDENFHFVANQRIEQSLQQTVEPTGYRTAEVDGLVYVYGNKDGKNCKIHMVFAFPKEQSEMYQDAIDALQKEILPSP